MSLKEELAQLKKRITQYEKLSQKADVLPKYKAFTLELLNLKKLLDQHLDSIPNDWSLDWWTDTPITIIDNNIRVRVKIGGFDMTTLPEIPAFSVTIEIDFAGTTTSLIVDTITNSNNSWHTFNASIAIPNTFLEGSFTVTATTIINDKTYTISDSIEIAGIPGEGQEVLDYLNNLNAQGKFLGYHNLLENLFIEDKGLRALNQGIQQLDISITDVRNSFLTPIQRLSAPAQALFERLLREQPYGCRAVFNRHYQLVFGEQTLAYNNLMNLISNLDNKQITDLTTLFIQPLQERITTFQERVRTIEAENAVMAAAYLENLQTIQGRTATGGELVVHLNALCELIPRFERLKEDHTFLNTPDETDAFKLVVKDRTLLETIVQELQDIRAEHQRLSTEIVSLHATLYRPNGTLRDRVLRQAARNETDGTFSLIVFDGVRKYLSVHEFIFGSIRFLARQANDFYANLNTLWLDFSRVDLSTEEVSIQAYAPPLDNEFHQTFQNVIINLSDDEKAESELSIESPDTIRLTDDNGINPEDIHQGAIGNCYFLSGIEALARFNPENIYGEEDSVISDPDEDGIYTVKLYVPDVNAENGLRRINIKVQPRFVEQTIASDVTPTVNDGRRIYSYQEKPFFAKKGTDGEIWVQILEQALAELEGSYREITGEDRDIDLTGLEILTGRRSTRYSLSDNLDNALQVLIQAHSSMGQIPMAQFSTKNTFPNIEASTIASGEDDIEYRPNTKLYSNHAYSLVDILNSATNTEILLLQNPHNHDLTDENGNPIGGGRQIEITRAELSTYFSYIEIN